MLSNAPCHLKTSQQASPTYFTAVYLSGHFSITVGSLLKWWWDISVWLAFKVLISVVWGCWCGHLYMYIPLQALSWSSHRNQIRIKFWTLMSQVSNEAKISKVVCIITILSSNNCIIKRGIDAFIGSNNDKTTKTFLTCKKQSECVTVLQLLFLLFFSFQRRLVSFMDAGHFGVEKSLNLGSLPSICH